MAWFPLRSPTNRDKLDESFRSCLEHSERDFDEVDVFYDCENADGQLQPQYHQQATLTGAIQEILHTAHNLQERIDETNENSELVHDLRKRRDSVLKRIIHRCSYQVGIAVSPSSSRDEHGDFSIRIRESSASNTASPFRPLHHQQQQHIPRPPTLLNDSDNRSCSSSTDSGSLQDPLLTFQKRNLLTEEKYFEDSKTMSLTSMGSSYSNIHQEDGIPRSSLSSSTSQPQHLQEVDFVDHKLITSATSHRWIHFQNMEDPEQDHSDSSTSSSSSQEDDRETKMSFPSHESQTKSTVLPSPRSITAPTTYKSNPNNHHNQNMQGQEEEEDLYHKFPLMMTSTMAELEKVQQEVATLGSGLAQLQHSLSDYNKLNDHKVLKNVQHKISYLFKGLKKVTVNLQTFDDDNTSKLKYLQQSVEQLQSKHKMLQEEHAAMGQDKEKIHTLISHQQQMIDELECRWIEAQAMQAVRRESPVNSEEISRLKKEIEMMKSNNAATVSELAAFGSYIAHEVNTFFHYVVHMFRRGGEEKFRWQNPMDMQGSFEEQDDHYESLTTNNQPITSTEEMDDFIKEANERLKHQKQPHVQIHAMHVVDNTSSVATAAEPSLMQKVSMEGFAPLRKRSAGLLRQLSIGSKGIASASFSCKQLDDDTARSGTALSMSSRDTAASTSSHQSELLVEAAKRSKNTLHGKLGSILGKDKKSTDPNVDLNEFNRQFKLNANVHHKNMTKQNLSKQAGGRRSSHMRRKSATATQCDSSLSSNDSTFVNDQSQHHQEAFRRRHKKSPTFRKQSSSGNAESLPSSSRRKSENKRRRKYPDAKTQSHRTFSSKSRGHRNHTRRPSSETFSSKSFSSTSFQESSYSESLLQVPDQSKSESEEEESLLHQPHPRFTKAVAVEGCSSEESHLVVQEEEEEEEDVTVLVGLNDRREKAGNDNDLYETPLQRMQKIVDSQSELDCRRRSTLSNHDLSDDEMMDAMIKEIPQEGEFSADDYITPLQRTRLKRSGSQEQLQLWDGNKVEEETKRNGFGQKGNQDKSLPKDDCDDGDLSSKSSSSGNEYYQTKVLSWDHGTGTAHEEIMTMFQPMNAQQQEPNFWEKVTDTFMLDPERALTKLETLESGDELSGDELRYSYTGSIGSSSEEESSTNSSCSEVEEYEYAPQKQLPQPQLAVPPVPASPWQEMSKMLLSPQVAVKKFVSNTVHLIPKLEITEEKKEPKEKKADADDGEQDFEPFTLKIRYRRRNSETSELSTHLATEISKKAFSKSSNEDERRLHSNSVSQSQNKYKKDSPKKSRRERNSSNVAHIHRAPSIGEDSSVDQSKDEDATVYSHATSFSKMMGDVPLLTPSIQTPIASRINKPGESVKARLQGVGPLPLFRGDSNKNMPGTSKRFAVESSAEGKQPDISQNSDREASNGRLENRESNATEKSFETVGINDICLIHQLSSRSISSQGMDLQPSTFDRNSLVSPGMRGEKRTLGARRLQSFDRNSLASPGMGDTRPKLHPTALISPGMGGFAGGRLMLSPGLSARALVSPGISESIKAPAVGGGQRTLDWSSPALMSPAIVPRPIPRIPLQREESTRSQMSEYSLQAASAELSDHNRWSHWQDNDVIASPYTPAQRNFASSAAVDGAKKKHWAGMSNFIDNVFLEEDSVASEGVVAQETSEDHDEHVQEGKSKKKGKRWGLKRLAEKVRSGLHLGNSRHD